MKEILTGRCALIDYHIDGNEVNCALAWFNKRLPETIELPGVGEVAIPDNLVNSEQTTIAKNCTLQIKNHAQITI